MKKITLLEMLDQKVKACKKCESLASCRQNTVFGEGNPATKIVFCGEGPGEQEDNTGRPFVGVAGQFLDSLLSAIGLARTDVYILNIVKCRPPGNRVPTPEEIENCEPFLKLQLKVINPKIIVCLGATATQAILKVDDGITQLRGRWHMYCEDPVVAKVMPTYHPSYIKRLKEEGKKIAKAQMWSDMQKVVAALQSDA